MTNNPLTAGRNLILTIAPELSSWPLYLVGCLPTWLPRDCLGGYLSRIDPLWVERLEERGLWQGNGRIIALAADALELPPEYLCGVVTHEAAHALPATEPAKLFARTPENLALCRQWAAETAAQSAAACPGGSADLHGPDFCRRLVHLRHRAEQLGGVVIPWDGFNARHGPCHISIMGRLLADEPQRMESATFAEIDATPAPVEFTRLWEHYTARKER